MQVSPPKYEARINVPVTVKMYQLADLLAKRQDTTLADVARQAIHEYLEAQEDLVNSRSRLGRTVMQELGKMHAEILGQLIHLTKLLLAGVIVLMMAQGIEAGDAAKRIANLAKQPGLGKMLDATK